MITYSEVDIKVSPSGDLVLGANGDFQLTAPSGCLKQDIAFRVLTDQNDFAPHPNIGANLNSLIGEPNNKATCTMGERYIVNSLTSDGRVFGSDLMVKGVPISLSTVVYYIFVRDGMTTLNVTPDVMVNLSAGLVSF